MSVNRESFVPFPKLDRADFTLKEAGDFFPGVQPPCFYCPGNMARRWLHATSRHHVGALS
jgi:hypothetical protein